MVLKGPNIRGHSFIYWMEPEIIAQKIADCTSNFELQQFRTAMHYYYEGHVYYETWADDIDHLRELQRILRDADRNGIGQIKTLYYRWINNDIDRYLKKIAPEEEV